MKLRISAGPVTPQCLSSPRGENGYQPLIALGGGGGTLGETSISFREERQYP